MKGKPCVSGSGAREKATMRNPTKQKRSSTWFILLICENKRIVTSVGFTLSHIVKLPQIITFLSLRDCSKYNPCFFFFSLFTPLLLELTPPVTYNPIPWARCLRGELNISGSIIKRLTKDDLHKYDHCFHKIQCPGPDDCRGVEYLWINTRKIHKG